MVCCTPGGSTDAHTTQVNDLLKSALQRRILNAVVPASLWRPQLLLHCIQELNHSSDAGSRSTAGPPAHEDGNELES